MKKVLLTVIFMLLSSQAFATEIAFRVDNEDILINGNIVKVTSPIESNGATLVPVRVISEAFGAKVVWDDLNKSIDVTKDSIKISMQIDSITASVNGNEEKLLCAPKLIGDSTMVPLRLISETFGAKVSYNDLTREIKVTNENVTVQEPAQNGYVKYINKELFWNIDIPTDLKIDERVKNEITFYKDNMKTRLTVSVYNKVPFETLDVAKDNEISSIRKIYSGRNFDLTNGQRIFKNYMTENISYNLNDDNLVFNASEMLFFCGEYKYKVHFYIETKDKEVMAKEKEIMQKAVNSFKAELINEKLSAEYDENFSKKYTNNITGYTVGVPQAWTVDTSNDFKYVFNDSVNKFKMELTCVEYPKIIGNAELSKYGIKALFSSSLANYDDTNVIFRKVFEYKGGMKVKEEIVSVYQPRRYEVATVNRYYKLVLPGITNDFYGTNDAYIFDVDDKKFPLRKINKDAYGIEDLTIKEFDQMKKASICYVFCENNRLFIADCYLSDYFSYSHNRAMYDKVIKTIFEK